MWVSVTGHVHTVLCVCVNVQLCVWWVLGTCLNERACLVHHKAGTQHWAWNPAGTWSMLVG